ncbi:Sad1 interacting factor 1 [Schizosaccharomyces cryophilus OY26]|uniref:Sad1 interacting factor 1 n=1 Tax=Schizosaccharomyces cryophilus (strain OY26 / ATCC MYA-4695 / CBS 11777 / NBRC 106824 / NRRL Y48691) TaxID=653667 RepID=S9VVD7_SCHCR|nr:Sad1 interacting factor 1 [Schizosaccharomyces cryophilus OY26]EPY50055.1 Sad1 interacting factor 1 [Schizosaccharomyces cryophilus OY26]
MSSAAEQARLRRERRMEKIRQGGNSRIHRILGQEPKEDEQMPSHVSTPETVASPSIQSTSKAESVMPSDTQISEEDKGDPRDLHNLLNSPFNLQSDTPSNVPPENMFAENPDFAKFFQALMQSSKEDNNGPFERPDATSNPNTYVENTQNQTLRKYVHLLFVAAIVCFCYFRRLPLLPWMFTVEACLLSIRLFLDRKNPPSSSLLMTLASQLPAPYASMIRHTTNYASLVSQLITDASVAIFVIGICCYISPSLL